MRISTNFTLLKKLATILLLILYTTGTIGATVHMHYCMGKLVSWGITNTTKAACGKCGMKQKTEQKGCCKDEHKTIKVKAEHQKGDTTNVTAPLLYSTLHTTQYTMYTQPSVPASITVTNYYHPPPQALHTRLYVLYGVFLI